MGTLPSWLCGFDPRHPLSVPSRLAGSALQAVPRGLEEVRCVGVASETPNLHSLVG